MKQWKKKKYSEIHQVKNWKLNSSSLFELSTLAALFFFLPFSSSLGKMADRHMETKWQQKKVTSSETGHLSSYLCTPNGSQQQRRWCQTGRSSTGCWMCCSAAVGLLYLNYKKTLSKKGNMHIKLMDTQHMLALNYMLHIETEMKVKIPS